MIMSRALSLSTTSMARSLRLREGIAGLVHISEFGSEDKLRAALELGKTYPFKITLFDAKDQKMALTYSAAKK